VAWQVINDPRTGPQIGGTIRDADDDGTLEIVIHEMIATGPTGYVMRMYENAGDNTYELNYEGVVADASTIYSQAVTDDLDGDGRREILIAGWFQNPVSSRVYAYENVGDDDFEIVWSHSFDPDINLRLLLDAGDLDGDGKKEFLAGGLKPGSPLQSVLHVLEAAGDDDYQIVASFALPNTAQADSAVNVADVHGDGKKEIVFAASWVVAIYENTGDDAWEPIWSETWASEGIGPVNSIGAGDHDGDGKAEIILRQDGSFGNTGIWEIRPEDAADADGDSRVDVVDNCPQEPNPAQEDADADGVGDACDTCIHTANPDQGIAVFGQALSALDAVSFGWDSPADVVHVRGPLPQVGGYAVDLVETLQAAQQVTDATAPAGGAGFYHLVRHDCPSGSWQSAPGAEPGRDAALP
jgi:hypothetical protein